MATPAKGFSMTRLKNNVWIKVQGLPAIMVEYNGIGKSMIADKRVSPHQKTPWIGSTISANNQKTVDRAAQQPKIQPKNTSLLKHSYQGPSGQSTSSFPAAVSSMVQRKNAEGNAEDKKLNKAREPYTLQLAR